MARIVAIHGVGQQAKSDTSIHAAWWPALQRGLYSAGIELTDSQDLTCPFYGNLFGQSGSLGSTPVYQPTDATQEEAALLQLFWEAAAPLDEQVPFPSSYAAEASLARVPQPVQRALQALSKSTFFARVTPSLLLGDTKQLLSYLREPSIHEAILAQVSAHITEDTRVVIGHSLGSVVAYEALCRKPAQVVSFITLGSPLGIRNLVFDQLTPAPDAQGLGKWPGHVAHWTNVADAGDLVALQKELASLFGPQVEDVLVYNGSDAHHGERYLESTEVGQAVRRGLGL
jgi:branched-subunit amino acid transport protein